MAYKKFGIDISNWQGNYNLNKAKAEGVEFVIIKAGGGDAGLYKDSKFENNYNKAKGLGLPVGVYWFSRALTTGEALKEAEFLYANCLKGKTFELPIFIDVEHKKQLAVGKRTLTNIIKAWCEYLQEKKYYVGIYSSLSFFKSYMYDAELKSYAHWVAQWTKSCTYNGVGIWQFGGETNKIRSTKVAGQVTDQNYMLVDYPAIIKEHGLNGFSKSNAKPVQKGLDLSNTTFDRTATKALQKWLGTYQDGEFSGQNKANKKYTPSISTCNYTDQYKLSNAVRAWQRFIIKSGYSVGASGTDGQLGHDTVLGWQKFLNAKGYKLSQDGIFGPKTSVATKAYLNKVVYGI